MKKITLFAFMILAFMACKHSHEDGHVHHHGDSADAGQWSEVDELHEVSMGAWSQFSDIEDALEDVLKQAKEDEDVLKGFSVAQVENVLTQVEKAFQDMNTWMENHGKIRKSIEGKTDKEVDKIIETERQNIQRINDDSEKALDAANEVLKALGIDMDIEESHGGHDHDHGGHDHEGHDH